MGKRSHASAGSTAEIIGEISAINAALWCIAADAEVARSWDGSKVDEHDDPLPGSDFARALELSAGPIRVGEGDGVVVQIGGCGTSKIWQTSTDVRLLEFFEGEADLESDEGLATITQGLMAVEAKRVEHIGTVEVSSGCMALLLPYTKAEYTVEEVRAAAAKREASAFHDGEQVLLPISNGQYEIFYELLDHDEPAGSFSARVRIAAG